MNSIPLNFRWVFLFSFVFIFACQDKIDERVNIIAGKWHIEKAEKDGTPISSLEGTVFEFTNEGKMMTNVPQLVGNTFAFDGKKLIQKGEKNSIKYEIEELSSSQLILKTILKDMSFRMVFGRDSVITFQ
jgi:hypothetical protein